MSKYIVNGQNKLFGEVCISGAKNSVLPILAASFIINGQSVLHNCPNISDVAGTIDILKKLGCKVKRENDTLIIDSKDAWGFIIPDDLMRKMRSSIIFLGAILSKCKKARISYPGGCELGARPIDLHIDAFKQMGVEISDEFGYLECSCKNGLKGANISLCYPSVGATENIMIAASVAKGQTIINNAAREPEICDLADFLIKSGAKIKGQGTSRIIIDGVKNLNPTTKKIMSDRIEAASFLCMALATDGEIEIKNITPLILCPILSTLVTAGAAITEYSDRIKIKRQGAFILPVKTIRTMPHPGFPTDIQAIMMALLTMAQGNSTFIETVFSNRYQTVGELLRMGADISVEGQIAMVNGVEKLNPATVCAHDLRGGAALILAGLCATGQTEILDAQHIDRGYENFDKKLRLIGADIKKM